MLERLYGRALVISIRAHELAMAPSSGFSSIGVACAPCVGSAGCPHAARDVTLWDPADIQSAGSAPAPSRSPGAKFYRYWDLSWAIALTC